MSKDGRSKLLLATHTFTSLCVYLCVLHSYAGQPSPTPSQECWRQLLTGSVKGKTKHDDDEEKILFSPLITELTSSSLLPSDHSCMFLPLIKAILKALELKHSLLLKIRFLKIKKHL